MPAGIVSYGVYIPKYRIRVEEIARVWGDEGDVSGNLNVFKKSVPDVDEDAVTIAVEASRNAIRRGRIDPARIGVIYTGSESHPYAVKPTGTIVGEAIGTNTDLTAADFEFACKAGTAAIQACLGLVSAGMVDLGMAIGSDTSQGAPGDALEYTAAAGGAAYVIGKDDLIAEIEDFYSFTTDTPDFWRREGRPYPEHGGRFTGEPAYFKHVTNAARGLMRKMGVSPEDYDYAVFHQPNGKFPLRVARQLGFTKEQIDQGLVVPEIGNTYSGSCLIGLAATLDVARPGDRIFAVSFGSGAGSDAFSIMVKDEIDELGGGVPLVRDYISETENEYLDYAMYAKHKGKLRL
ncbi:MAG: hydroxymethylglutaryl-CoA synthase [Methanotrichaceae archaeon]